MLTSKRIYILFQFIILLSLCSFLASVSKSNNVPDSTSYSSAPVQLILPEDTRRDEKLLMLTKHDSLTAVIIGRHSLIVGSKAEIVCRSPVFAWLVNHMNVSADLGSIMGTYYRVTPGTVYEYHGEDGKGLSVEFYSAYSDSHATVFTGVGEIKFLYITFSGSFINFLEYYNTSNRMIRQNCMYVMINNPVTRFIVDIIFKVTHIEEAIKEKLQTMDVTTDKVVRILIEEPYIYLSLKNPEVPVPEGTIELTISMKNAIVRGSSLKEAQELGLLIEKARIEMGYR